MASELTEDVKCFVRVLGAPVVLLVVCCFAGCYGCSRVQYSEGHRDGIVEKVSLKGVIWKTHEGQLVLGGMAFNSDGNGGGNLTARVFKFSVNDEEVVKKLNKIPPGRQVRVFYKEKLAWWAPKGDTSYFVVDVEEIVATGK